MEKISGILSASPRVKSVDMKNETPVRPGAPSFGRTEGRNTVKDRVSISNKDEAFKETLGYKNTKDARQAKMVEELNKRFFETRVAKPEVVVDTPTTADLVSEATALANEVPVGDYASGHTGDLAADYSAVETE